MQIKKKKIICEGKKHLNFHRREIKHQFNERNEFVDGEKKKKKNLSRKKKYTN